MYITKVYEPDMCLSGVRSCLIEITPETANMLLHYMDMILELREENEETIDITLWDAPEVTWLRNPMTDFSDNPPEERDASPISVSDYPEGLNIYESVEFGQRAIYPHVVVWRTYFGDFMLESANISRGLLEQIALEGYGSLNYKTPRSRSTRKPSFETEIRTQVSKRSSQN